MRVLIYSPAGAFRSFATDRMRVEGTVRRIARGTDTRRLLVVVQLNPDTSGWSGAFYSKDISRHALHRMRGPWKSAHSGGIPPGLPDKFALIEVSMGCNGISYPRVEYNQNGFRIWLRSFHAHLAYIFAHELHHYRRYKLGLHGREGEKSADKWAVGRACEMGYAVSLKPCRKHDSSRRKRRTVPSRPVKMSEDYWNRIRNLKRWSLVRLMKSDNRKVPAGTILRFLRPLRASYRVLVLDHMGFERLVPTEWLRIVEEK